MKTASIHSLIAAAILAGGAAFTLVPAARADNITGQEMTEPTVQVADLKVALKDRVLSEGWNKILSVSERGDQIWAEVRDGKIRSWQVKSYEGKDLRTHVRNAEDPNNLRLTWEPETGPGRFLEAPASVIRP